MALVVNVSMSGIAFVEEVPTTVLNRLEEVNDKISRAYSRNVAPSYLSVNFQVVEAVARLSKSFPRRKEVPVAPSTRATRNSIQKKITDR
jgi:hypothetical protein